MRFLRLRGRKTVSLLLRKGRVWKGRTLAVHWLPVPPRHASMDPAAQAVYVGALASAKLHKSAVARNRMRRRCREALRVLAKDRADLPASQLLLSPRLASLDAPYADILADIRTFLSVLACPTPPSARVSSNSR